MQEPRYPAPGVAAGAAVGGYLINGVNEMQRCSHMPLAIFAAWVLFSANWTAIAKPDTPAAAQALGRARAAVPLQPDGLYICEAEEFQTEPPTPRGWKAQRWGENYYAATLANSFLSRKAFLGAPEQCEQTVAAINVDVDEAGQYLVSSGARRLIGLKRSFVSRSNSTVNASSIGCTARGRTPKYRPSDKG